MGRRGVSEREIQTLHGNAIITLSVCQGRDFCSEITRGEHEREIERDTVAQV